MATAQFARNACQSIQRLSQATLIGLMANPMNNPVLNNPLVPNAAPSKAFVLDGIPLDHWDIMSFDPSTRQVCVRLYVYDVYGQRTGDFRLISVTLPVVTYNPSA